MTVHNMYRTAIVYNLSSVGAATLNPFIQGDDSVQVDTEYTSNYGSVYFYNGHSYSTQMLLSVPAGQSAVVKVMFYPLARTLSDLLRLRHRHSHWVGLFKPQSKCSIRRHGRSLEAGCSVVSSICGALADWNVQSFDWQCDT